MQTLSIRLRTYMQSGSLKRMGTESIPGFAGQDYTQIKLENMKTNVRHGLLYVFAVCGMLALASCGRSGKNRVELRVLQDSAVVIEEESLVVEMDTIVPDTTKK